MDEFEFNLQKRKPQQKARVFKYFYRKVIS